MEPMAMVMRRIMSEWFGHAKRRDETENIRTVADMKMKPMLGWKNNVRKNIIIYDVSVMSPDRNI